MSAFKDFINSAVSDCVNAGGSMIDGYWQRVRYNIDHEEHVLYVGGEYAGTVWRRGAQWFGSRGKALANSTFPDKETAQIAVAEAS